MEQLHREILEEAVSLVETFERHYPETGLEFMFSGSLLLVFRGDVLVFTWSTYEGLQPLIDFLRSNR